MEPTLPNFLIIGAQKSGSSWLANALRHHPDVFMPKDEVHFFDKAYNWDKGTDWYAAFFRDARGRKAVGEKTPDYLWTHGEGVEDHLPDVHENIHRALPDAKLIAVLRNPVDRAISAVKHVLRSGRISPIHSLDDLLMGASRHLLAGYGILEYGLYFRQLEAYREFFAPEQMMVLVLEEDILKTPERTLFEVCRFLEIDPDFCESDPGFEIREKANENTSSRAGLLLSYYLPPLRRLVGRVDRRLPGRLAGPSRATRRSLCEYYREENEKLFELLGRRIASW